MKYFVFKKWYLMCGQEKLERKWGDSKNKKNWIKITSYSSKVCSFDKISPTTHCNTFSHCQVVELQKKIASRQIRIINIIIFECLAILKIVYLYDNFLINFIYWHKNWLNYIYPLFWNENHYAQKILQKKWIQGNWLPIINKIIFFFHTGHITVFCTSNIDK